MDRDRWRKTLLDKESRDKTYMDQTQDQVASSEAVVRRSCLPTGLLDLLGEEDGVPTYLSSPVGKGWAFHPICWERDGTTGSQETWVLQV